MLTERFVASLKYQEKRSNGPKSAGALVNNVYRDRDGLYLVVTPPSSKLNHGANYGYGRGYGTKSWRYDFRFPKTTRGLRRVIVYGKFPEMTLAQARHAHLQARIALAAGIDPAERKQEVKKAVLLELDARLNRKKLDARAVEFERTRRIINVLKREINK